MILSYQMIKRLLYLPIFLFFLSCESFEPKVPIGTLINCNEQLRICNEESNKNTCRSNDSNSCIKQLLDGQLSGKDREQYDEYAEKCQEDYNICLRR